MEINKLKTMRIKPKDTKKKCFLAVRLNADENKKVEQVCKSNKINRSQLLRFLLENLETE